MTAFDYVILGIVGISLVIGLWRGMVGEIVALAAWGVAIFLSVEFGGDLGRLAFAGIADPALRAFAGCVVIFLGVLVIAALLRYIVTSLLKAAGLSLADRVLGLLFGFLRGALICMVLAGLGGMTSAPAQTWWRSATLAPPLETAVMATLPWLPDELAKRIRFS